MPLSLSITIAFLGFLVVGTFLATGHSGFAEKLATYIYFFVLGVVLWSLFNSKDGK